MFFYRNKHMMIDLGTGNNNKINWAMTEEQEFIDIVEVSLCRLLRPCRASLSSFSFPSHHCRRYTYRYTYRSSDTHFNLQTVYRGARKGRGLVVSPKDYSTKYRY